MFSFLSVILSTEGDLPLHILSLSDAQIQHTLLTRFSCLTYQYNFQLDEAISHQSIHSAHNQLFDMRDHIWFLLQYIEGILHPLVLCYNYFYHEVV